MTKAYNEIINFIALGTSAGNVVGLQLSEEVKNRVGELIARKKKDGLSLEETTELNLSIQLEHVMRLVKARSRRSTVV